MEKAKIVQAEPGGKSRRKEYILILSIKDFIELKEKLNQIGVEITQIRYDDNLVFIEVRKITEGEMSNMSKTKTFRVTLEEINLIQFIRYVRRVKGEEIKKSITMLEFESENVNPECRILFDLLSKSIV